MSSKTKDNQSPVIIIGAGPAGLAAAYELSVRNRRKCLIFEKCSEIGGLSRTVEYKKFRMDIGPHRFFTKNTRVDKLWHKVLSENEFQLRDRQTRIYYNNIFFNYPLKALEIPFKLGLLKTLHIAFSYFKRHLMPVKPEDNFESWVRNRFGDILYEIFFHDYTKKVWGVNPNKIDAEWAAQRIRSLSLGKVIFDTVKLIKKSSPTSLISQFRYPVEGAGMMYVKMAEDIQKSGSEIITGADVTSVKIKNNSALSVTVQYSDGSRKNYPAAHIISSMPLDELATALSDADTKLKNAAESLSYRSLVTVNLIFDKLVPQNDHWIYLNSSDVKAGRMNLFHNWSVKMTPDNSSSCVSLEYFCNENDELWNTPDSKLAEMAEKEIEVINFMREFKPVDSRVIRYRKAYPCYLGEYKKSLTVIRNRLKEIPNLIPVGRYGQFRYNNMDHSIETGILAAEKITGKNVDPWSVNEEAEYHEEQ